MYSDIHQLREKISLNYKDQDRFILLKVLDKAQTAMKTWGYTCTDFLDPFKRALVRDLLLHIKGLQYIEFGGYENANRQSFVFMTSDMSKELFEPDQMFALVSVTPTAGIDALTHRDYLGAVMNLSINRDFFGDIVLNPKGCMIIGKKSIIETIHTSLTNVGKYTVSTQMESLEDIIVPEEKVNEQSISVSSLRLDGIISKAFHISRSDAADYIKSGKVFVNYKETIDLSKSISENTVISCKGLGKMELLEVSGETKKGRLRIKINVYQ